MTKNNVITVGNINHKKSMDNLWLRVCETEEVARDTIEQCNKIKQKLEHNEYKSYVNLEKIFLKIAHDNHKCTNHLLSEQLAITLEALAQEAREANPLNYEFMAFLCTEVNREIMHYLEDIENLGK